MVGSGGAGMKGQEFVGEYEVAGHCSVSPSIITARRCARIENRKSGRVCNFCACCTLPSLLTTLEREVAEKNDAVALGLVRAVKSYSFVATLYLLSDVLPHLSSLSLVFQRVR